MNPKTHHPHRYLLAVASTCLMTLSGCTTSLLWCDQKESVAIAVGLPMDIAVPTIIGAVAGPPGGAIGAVVGVVLAALDFVCAGQLGKL
jgi:hypothetical protein